MSAAKRKSEARNSENRHIEPREAFHLSEAMEEALTKYVADQRPKTTKSAVIRMVLEDFLIQVGYLKLEKGDK